MTTNHSYHDIGENRGTPRIWINNLALAAAGFERGARYTRVLNLDTGTITLQLDPNGEKLVSGRRRSKASDEYVPIIDLCYAELLDNLGGDGRRVRIDYFAGRLEINVHHLCQKISERRARLLRNLRRGEITEGTICAGVGMATLALKEGFAANGIAMRTEWIVDRDGRYTSMAMANNPAVTDRTQVIEASLEELEPELLGPVDILQVSLPCTGHSKSGKSKNKIKTAEEHATDATAIYGMMKLLEPINPGIIVSENVREARDSATYTLLRQILDLLGYRVHEVDLNSDQSGAIEHRNRYWLVAVDKGIDSSGLLEAIPTYARRYATLREALDLTSTDDARWSANAYLKDKATRDAAAGKGFARNLVTGTEQRINTIGRHYNKRRSTEPMLTRADGMERLLTPAEHARVKLADPSLVAGWSDTVAHEVLGQGIDMGQARGLAEALASVVLLPIALPTKAAANG